MYNNQTIRYKRTNYKHAELIKISEQEDKDIAKELNIINKDNTINIAMEQNKLHDIMERYELSGLDAAKEFLNNSKNIL